jgi:hypothetical protein
VPLSSDFRIDSSKVVCPESLGTVGYTEEEEDLPVLRAQNIRSCDRKSSVRGAVKGENHGTRMQYEKVCRMLSVPGYSGFNEDKG